ncbi:SCP2 sterol-binding domain-containing protein [Nonomuraea sp. SYSU D8015]|uniref:SCP2 sterol-binding domain-containing protein n=1 Tax=Nonomuraea sp. SYSU D8015 TaxID=2593644 RepID=UPI0016609CFE|nr:SCP2 sterol-binding domain-containing protein [Nonomuraea sp. SYSU D8015]
MTRYLTEEWMELALKTAESLPERRGANGRLQYVLTGGPDGGEIRYYWILENGRLTGAACGQVDDPDFTVTMTYADSVLIEKGELSDEDAYAQGRTKFTGSMSKAMRLMPLLNSAEFKEVQDRIRAATEF